MPLSPEKALELADGLAENFRLIAKEHPASGAMRVMARHLANQTIWGWIEKIARTHMVMSMKARQRGQHAYAVWHCGAASALKDSKRWGRSYAIYTSALLKEGEQHA